MTSPAAIPVSAPEADETPEAALERRTNEASSTAEELTALRQYSSEVCAGLNSDGHTWECPEDSVGLVPTDAGKAIGAAIIDGLLPEFDDLRSCE